MMIARGRCLAAVETRRSRASAIGLGRSAAADGGDRSEVFRRTDDAPINDRNCGNRFDVDEDEDYNVITQITERSTDN